MKSLPIVFLSALIFLLAGCTKDISNQTYDANAVNYSRSAERGVVIKVRGVTVQDNNNVGTIAGGAVGAIAGSNIGKGSGSAVGAIAGAVAGGILGNKIEENVNQQQGWEYVVELSNGSLRTVVQGGAMIPVNSRVILMGGNQARIVLE